MPEQLVGVCPGCGSGPKVLRFSTVNAVVESGCENAICSGCEERITAKRVIEAQRDPSLTPKERDAEVARLRDKVKPAEPAPATPAAPAPVPQGKASPTG
jgi:hypothetical protein